MQPPVQVPVQGPCLGDVQADSNPRCSHSQGPVAMYNFNSCSRLSALWLNHGLGILTSGKQNQAQTCQPFGCDLQAGFQLHHPDLFCRNLYFKQQQGAFVTLITSGCKALQLQYRGDQ